MAEPTPVVVEGATKVLDGVRVLDSVSFSAEPGRVTALLGPNGAGKSSVLRAIVGIDRLSGGRVSIGGRRLSTYGSPATVVGASLSPDTLHPRRTPRDHLRIVALSNGLPHNAVDEVIRLTGITAIADVRAAELSLGMRQRAAVATALIGDPDVVILDEPHNGLDTAAIRWLRTTLRVLADAGRTIILSTHLMAEVDALADDVVVICRGAVIASGHLADYRGDQPLEQRYLADIGEWMAAG